MFKDSTEDGLRVPFRFCKGAASQGRPFEPLFSKIDRYG